MILQCWGRIYACFTLCSNASKFARTKIVVRIMMEPCGPGEMRVGHSPATASEPPTPYESATPSGVESGETPACTPGVAVPAARVAAAAISGRVSNFPYHVVRTGNINCDSCSGVVPALYSNLESLALNSSPRCDTDALLTPEYIQLIIEIEDDGCGIDAADIPTLFKPFSQIRPLELQQGKGSGLGLAICHELTHLHNGAITVLSTKNVGAVFRVEIPVRVGQWFLPAHPLEESDSSASSLSNRDFERESEGSKEAPLSASLSECSDPQFANGSNEEAPPVSHLNKSESAFDRRHLHGVAASPSSQVHTNSPFDAWLAAPLHALVVDDGALA
jgi:hypothetical protein